jgi:hypothetical protein
MISGLLSRDQELELFVSECFPKGKTDVTSIEGDAGFRKYFRATNSGNNYILMDCPTSYCNLEPFVRIANYLSKHSISAPQIISQNIKGGFLLLEDFGNLSIKSHIEQQGWIPFPIVNQATEFKGDAAERNNIREHKRVLQNSIESFKMGNGARSLNEIYYLIIDLLVLIQDLPILSELQFYNDELLLKELEGFANWYVPYKTGAKLAGEELGNFMDVWKRVLSKQIKMEKTIVHRDYHAENMMYLPARKGINSIGILDFQDAIVGSPIYDLVSVLEDARIDVPRQIALDCVQYYAQKKNFSMNDILLNYHILGAQRNTRILGVFARKAMRDNDNRYIKYIPLVLNYLQYDLSHPALSELKLLFTNLL